MKGTVFNIQKFCLHDGPGIRTTVFFKGCNLRCGWCANPESQCRDIQLTLDTSKCTGCGKCTAACPPGVRRMQGRYPVPSGDACRFCGACIEACPNQAAGMEGSKKDIAEILAEVIKDKPFYDRSGGGVTFSGGEPLIQYEFACALADELHARGISVAIETAGCIDPQRFADFLAKTDFAYIDLKHYDSEKHLFGTGLGNETVLQNIRTLKESGRPFKVRIPVIPGFNDSKEDAAGFARLLHSMGIETVQLLPFHQMGEKKYQLLGREYAYTGFAQLTAGNLTGYKDIFKQHGVHAEI